MPAVQANVTIPTLCVHSPLDSTAKLNYTYRNKIINGAFTIWQRGVSFALAAAAYTADRWYVSLIGNVTRESFLPGESELMDNSRFYLQTSPAGSGTAFIEQRVESVWTLAGKQTTLTFWAKSGISGSTLPVFLVQNFGTTLAVSAGADVTTVVGTATLTTAWVKHTMTVTLPSIAGKTVGTDGNDYVAIKFTLPIDDVSICNVQWEQGPLATDFELRPYDEELRLCRRFYEQIDLVLNQIALAGIGMSGTEATFVILYQEKRVVPTITVPSALKIYSNTSTPTWTTPVPDTSTVKRGNQLATVASGCVLGTVVVGQASATCAVLIESEL
jgi:hypothetical protein